VIRVPASDPTRPSHYRRRYDAAARALDGAGAAARGRALRLPAEPPVYESWFRVGPGQERHWATLFGAQPGACPPFSYHTTCGSILLLHLLADLGLTIGQILHVQSSATYEASVVGAGPRRLRVRLDQAVPLGPDRAALVLELEVARPDGTPLQIGREVFAVVDLPEEWRPAAERSPLFRPASPGLLLRRPVHRTGTVRRTAIVVPPDLGVRYGLLSGDLNTHDHDATGGRPFLQGLCTANLVVAAVAEDLDLARFSILFARPVFVDQTLELLIHDAGFELRDEGGRLVAFGAFHAAAASDALRASA
jgi:hypothetical protein